MKQTMGDRVCFSPLETNQKSKFESVTRFSSTGFKLDLPSLPARHAKAGQKFPIENSEGKLNSRAKVIRPEDKVSQVLGRVTLASSLQAFNKWVGMKENKLFDSLLELIEILQNASLMIDDIEDGSELRRGLPCAHIVYGVPSTINSANYYYFLAMQKLTEISPPEKLQKIMQTAIKGILNLHEVGAISDAPFRLLTQSHQPLQISRARRWICIFATI